MLKLRLRGDTWYAMGTITRLDGKRVRVKRSTKFTYNQKNQAKSLLPTIQADVIKQTCEPKKEKRSDYLVADMNSRYLSRPEGFLSLATNYILKDFDGVFGKREVLDLDIKEVYSHFNRKGTKPSSIRKEMATLIASINYSKMRGFPYIIFKDEQGKEVNLVKPPEGEGRLRWLSMKQRDHLISCCDEAIKDLVAFLFYTGARLGNAFELTDQNIIGDEVMLYTRKGRARKVSWRKVPIVTAIKPMMMARCGGGLVFPNPLGTQWRRSGVNNDGRKSDNTNFYHFWNDACEKAGITDFKPHDARHTFASLLRQNGAGLDELQELLGHASLEMVRRYAHLAPSKLKSVIERLDATSDVSVPNLSHESVVLTEGIEPSTSALPKQCSTTELRQHKRLDINTSKVADKEVLDFITKDKKTNPLAKKPP